VQIAYRELAAALQHEEAQTRETYQGHGIMQRYLEGCAARTRLYPASVLGSRESRWAPMVGMGGAGWIEYAL
jgi:hypothetical protein